MQTVTSRGGHTYIRQNNLKSKTVARDTEGHYIMMKRSIHQEDVTIIYRLNFRALKYKANTDRNEGRNTQQHSNFTTSLSIMDATPTEDQERNKRGQHYTLEEAKGNRQNILLSSRIHILLKSTCMSPGDKMNLNK